MKLDSIISTATIKSTNSNEASISRSSNDVNVLEENRKNEALNNENLSEKTIKEVIDNTNKKLIATNRKFEFSINEETNDVIVKVINKETDELIREIPSEKILDMVAKMMELAGLFIDEKR
ncbi:flagellar protein FlaG [Wukongibacter sp. M2B1]|uniref:flagellar protein FlaG n=1 Tax=Wukongibacter sp. M2B1 TaxID=3088895 RepID=UPI003D7946B3